MTTQAAVLVYDDCAADVGMKKKTLSVLFLPTDLLLCRMNTSGVKTLI